MAKSFWGRAFGWVRGSSTESHRFGGYQVLKLLHEGEKACVYQARSPEDKRLAAVKAFKPPYNRTARRMRKRYHLRTEGEMGLLLNPRGKDDADDWPIVRTLGEGHEFDDPAQCYYLVQEYIDGFNVKHLLGCGDPLLGKQRMDIARSVARALAIIHNRGMIHRDICMDNILLTRDHKAKLIDLGFMAPVGITFEERTGTLSYMSPEQFLVRPLYAASDVYAFGVLLFELFTSKLPFTSSLPSDKPELMMRRTSELMAKHVKEAPPRPSEVTNDLPEGIEPIILKCLEKAPQNRYADMHGVLRDLDKVRDGGR